MIVAAWSLLFALIVTALVVAPFLPALYEWLRPSDTGPLNVPGNFDGSIRVFATAFEHLVRDAVSRRLVAAQEQGDNDSVAAIGRHKFRLIGAPGRWTEEQASAHDTSVGLVAAGNLLLPAGFTSEREVMAYGSLQLGEGAQVRCAMATGDLVMSSNAQVNRWVDCAGDLVLGDGAAAPLRASAGRLIVLAAGNTFERLAAPTIQVGNPVRSAAPRPAATEIRLAGVTAIDDEGHYLRAPADLKIPAGHRVVANLIVYGALRLGPGAEVEGSVKAHGAIALEPGARISKAVTAVGAITFGAGSTAGGPVTSESAISLHRGATVGRPDQLTTLSAEQVEMAAGVVVHGTVWARSGGTTARREDITSGWITTAAQA